MPSLCAWQVVTDEQTSKNPVEFVASLLEMQTKFNILLQEAFFQDKILKDVMRRCASLATFQFVLEDVV